ncbi:sensor domain-containing diguanylate cyclase [Bacillus sp. HMF5848]|uniref:sensor domain-containing diguanylate cyclase n=1 Tax=Bacillus sp. HMF5848 TaxID=2495421 RepID=UPI000F79FFF0|nr:sensor domain-containing diguanylate cyclase [Bacillus sp. HMF5848]RSK28655.1 sensor domain-containing diguanylate cyclase [Bacillus sp. HMF5848]
MNMPTYIEQRNELMAKLLCGFYVLELIINVLVEGLDMLFPPVGLVFCLVLILLVYKRIAPNITMYIIITSLYGYLFYLITDYPYLVNFMFVYIGLVLSSIYQSYKAIMYAGVLTVGLTFYSFFSFHNEIFPNVSTSDLVYLVMFAAFITIFFLFYIRFITSIVDRSNETQQKLQYTLDSANIVTWSYEIDTGFLKLSNSNGTFSFLERDYKSDTIFLHSLLHEDDVSEVAFLEERLRNGFSQTHEFRFELDAKTIWVECHGYPVKYEGSITHVEGVLIDITRRKELEAHMTYMAYHDHLTGLPNRMMLKTWYPQVIKKCKNKFAVMFIDFDNFKNINDTYGHDIGDKVLKEVTNQLKEALRATDMLSRIGGDEFTAVIANVDIDKALDVANRILEELQNGVMIEGHHIEVTASIGVCYPERELELEKLLQYADEAMYNAKQEGKNQISIWNEKDILNKNIS